MKNFKFYIVSKQKLFTFMIHKPYIRFYLKHLFYLEDLTSQRNILTVKVNRFLLLLLIKYCKVIFQVILLINRFFRFTVILTWLRFLEHHEL